MKKNYRIIAALAASMVMLCACGKEAATETATTEATAEASTEATADEAAQSTADVSTDAAAEGTSGSIDVSGLEAVTLNDVDIDSLVKLGDYKGITLDLKKTEVTDADVEDSLKSAYSQNPNMKEVTDRAIESGDTAMICFDRFEVDNDGWKAFYAGEGERPLEHDSFGTVLSGLERAAMNPEIKNIIIDISCNGGGDDVALFALEWLIYGTAYIRYKNMFTNQINKQSAEVDINFDGLFDDEDVSPYTDYNYGILTSDFSFSCGNAFPAIAQKENSVKIIGQKSGGGECAVAIHYLPNSEYVYHSSNLHIGLFDEEKNTFTGFEGGATPDIEISDISNFYSIEYLNNAIRNAQ